MPESNCPSTSAEINEQVEYLNGRQANARSNANWLRSRIQTDQAELAYWCERDAALERAKQLVTGTYSDGPAADVEPAQGGSSD